MRMTLVPCASRSPAAAVSSRWNWSRTGSSFRFVLPRSRRTRSESAKAQFEELCFKISQRRAPVIHKSRPSGSTHKLPCQPDPHHNGQSLILETVKAQSQCSPKPLLLLHISHPPAVAPGPLPPIPYSGLLLISSWCVVHAEDLQWGWFRGHGWIVT